MAITATPSEEKKRSNPSSGNHVARCYGVIELGTITEEGKFGMKSQRKVLYLFETPEETHVFDQEKGPEPYSITKKYTISMYKSNLRKDLESWRGSAYDDSEADKVDISAVIGKPCMLNIEITAKGYPNILSISPLPKTLKCPPQINKSIKLEYDNFDWTVYESLPDWIKKIIQGTPEYKKLSEGGDKVNDHLDEQYDELPF